MGKHLERKSLSSFEDSAMIAKEAAQINGSSTLLSQLHSLNLSYIDILKSCYERYKNSGFRNPLEYTRQVHSAIVTHSRQTTNLVCYGNVNGLDA